MQQGDDYCLKSGCNLQLLDPEFHVTTIAAHHLFASYYGPLAGIRIQDSHAVWSYSSRVVYGMVSTVPVFDYHGNLLAVLQIVPGNCPCFSSLSNSLSVCLHVLGLIHALSSSEGGGVSSIQLHPSTAAPASGMAQTLIMFMTKLSSTVKDCYV